MFAAAQRIRNAPTARSTRAPYAKYFIAPPRSTSALVQLHVQCGTVLRISCLRNTTLTIINRTTGIPSDRCSGATPHRDCRAGELVWRRRPVKTVQFPAATITQSRITYSRDCHRIKPQYRAAYLRVRPRDADWMCCKKHLRLPRNTRLEFPIFFQDPTAHTRHRSFY